MGSKWKWFAAGAFTHWLLSGKKQDDAEYQEKLEKAKEEGRTDEGIESVMKAFKEFFFASRFPLQFRFCTIQR